MSQISSKFIIQKFQSPTLPPEAYSPKNLVLLSPTQLSFKEKVYSCATGKGGIREDKSEGDGATPMGIFELREILYRPDRLTSTEIELIKKTGLPSSPLTPADGWCDAPDSPHYNKHITLPSLDHHECLWREESIYDIIIPLGYNDAPVIPGKGSAIFMHLARPDYSPTEGCIALSRKNFLKVLRELA